MRNLAIIKAMGVIIIIMALVIMIVPQFSNCYAAGRTLTTQDGKSIPMKCYWSAIAEVATGLPLLAIGILMLISRKKESIRNISILGIITGILAVLIPTVLIGVCAMPTMICVTVMKPIILTAGIISIIASIISLVGSGMVKEDK